MGKAPAAARDPGDRDAPAGGHNHRESIAAAHFEFGQHFYRAGRIDDAARHFRRAHELQPDNWTYRRQAWSLADPEQGPTPHYASDWLSDVLKIGAENYYPPLDL